MLDKVVGQERPKKSLKLLSHSYKRRGIIPPIGIFGGSGLGKTHLVTEWADEIEWDADGGMDRITAASFLDGTTPTEAAFNGNAVSISYNFDQTTIDTLSIGQNRFNVDEIRLGTEFADIISGTSVGGPGDDPIPEPVTMLALFAGLGGLGGYVRRRKRG